MPQVSRPLEERFADRVVVRDDGCHEWIGARCPAGYGTICIADASHPKRGYTVRAHRLALAWKLGVDVRSLTVVRHSCDRRWCVNEDYLSDGTVQDNADDMTSRRRSARRYDDDLVNLIRRWWDIGTKPRIIAEVLDVPNGTVHHIGKRERQAHVPEYVRGG